MTPLDRKTTEQYIFGMLFKLTNEIQNAGNQIFPEVTIRQWYMLVMLKQMEGGSASISRLAAFTGSTRQNCMQVLTALSHKGYVHMATSASDRRSKTVTLTDAAYALFAKSEAKGDTYLDWLYDGLSMEDLVKLRSMVDGLLGNAAAMQDGEGGVVDA